MHSSQRCSEEAELVEGLLAGSVEAFQTFFRRQAPEVIAVCRRILNDAHEAEDVASEVFFEFWNRRSHYDPSRATPRGYLLLLARSRAIDRYRSRMQRAARLESHQQVEPESTAQDDPTAVASHTELTAIATRALGQLEDRQRQALQLAFFEGLTHVEVATKLDMPLGTVKSLIRRGLQKVRATLADFHAEAEQ